MGQCAEDAHALPIFIKFDDTEYAVRALEHGYHTVFAKVNQ